MCNEVCSPEMTSSSCKQCSKQIDGAIFICIACDNRFHWTNRCTGFEDELLKLLSQVRNNFLLVCNTCSDSGKRDQLISDISNMRNENKFTESIAEIRGVVSDLGSKLAENQEEIKVTASSMLSTVSGANFWKQSRPEGSNGQIQDSKSKARESDPLAVRIRGIPEKGKSTNEKLLHDRKQIEEIMDILGTKCVITDITRAGNPKIERKSARPLIVTFSNVWEKRIVLSSLSKLKNSGKKIYQSRLFRRRSEVREKAFSNEET